MGSTDRKEAVLTSFMAVGRSPEKTGPEANGARAEQSYGGGGIAWEIAAGGGELQRK
jgi:hypothetical protein